MSKPSTPASDFVFRHRSLFIILIFGLAFGSYAIEPVNSVAWLQRTLSHRGPAFGLVPWMVAVHALFATGAIFIGLAALFRTWGTAYLTSEVVRDSAIRADRLVADGPYRYARNPLYLGTMLVALGFAPMAPPIGAMMLVAGMGFLVLRLIRCEESFLLEKQAEAYRSYAVRVPRFWPALRPRLPSSGARPRWGQAFVGELWLWIMFAGAAVFAFSLNPKLFNGFVWIGMALYVLLRIVIRRRAQSRPA